ncbi:hypothetical protein QQ045_029746 [Rhodiola kirilowii]
MFNISQLKRRAIMKFDIMLHLNEIHKDDKTSQAMEETVKVQVTCSAMIRDGVTLGSSLKPLLKFMEEKVPELKMSTSDLPDIKLGEDIKECFLAAPLRRKLSAEDLIKEIATLEMQVVQLEKHLLFLYRKKFDQQDKLNYSSHLVDLQLSALCNKNEFKSSSARFCSEHYGRDLRTGQDDKLRLLDHSPIQRLENKLKKGTEKWGQQKISGISRTHSSLSGHFGVNYSAIQRIVTEAAQSDHSQPLSMFEAQDASSGPISQGSDFDAHETPNWISEEMIKCISTIYCTLSDPQLNHAPSSSQHSFSAATDELSLGSHLENSFVYEKSRFSGTYFPLVEVKHISKESKKLRDADHTLHRFRALVLRLVEVDPRKLKHREKLAFWINVHNALVMHAFLVYGIPQNSLKRMSLVFKAAYSVGGQTVNVEKIQRSILRCHLPCAGQWFQSVLFRTAKFKPIDPRRLFATDHTEPLLHFALCAGTHSDPAVRAYTAGRVYQELEAAKDEYIQLGLKVHKEHKILLPKKVELFAKDCDLNTAAFVELLEPFLPSSVRRTIKQKQRVNLWKSIRWIPHNFAFRYLFSNELVG